MQLGWLLIESREQLSESTRRFCPCRDGYCETGHLPGTDERVLATSQDLLTASSLPVCLCPGRQASFCRQSSQQGPLVMRATGRKETCGVQSSSKMTGKYFHSRIGPQARHALKGEGKTSPTYQRLWNTSPPMSQTAAPTPNPKSFKQDSSPFGQHEADLALWTHHLVPPAHSQRGSPHWG